MRIISSGRYAAVASTLALVVALGGTGYAAVMISGSQIKDNTVTTKDIKDKTLKVKDFASGTKTSLKGATGPAGATGATGATGAAGAAGAPGAAGATGPIGPSNVFTVYNDNSTTGAATTKQLLTMTVQPGSYLAYAKTYGHRSVTGSVAYHRCNLFLNATTLDVSGADLPDVSAAYSNVSNTASFTTAAVATVHLDCYISSGVTVDYKKLTVVKVGSVTNTAGLDVARPAQQPQGR